MRSPCRYTIPLARRLVQPRVRLWGFVHFHFLSTGALTSMNVVIRLARTSFWKVILKFVFISERREFQLINIKKISSIKGKQNDNLKVGEIKNQ